VSRLLVAQRALTVPGWAKDALWSRAQAIPSLDLRFADNKSLVDAVTGQQLVTFTRASSGTFTDSAGTLQTAATDVPRFDHNPTTGESLGLLVEEARTNLAVQSNAFTTTWARVASTLTSASAISPDGTTNGWRFADTAVSSTHNINQFITWTAVATTFTIYAKYDTHRWIGARIGMTGNQFFGSWDLQNGVVGSFTAGATIGMQAVGNGWYRLTLTATLTTAGTANVIVHLNNADSASVLTYTGTATSSYIYGAQVEVGVFPTSYIPTTTAAATRAADVASITGSAFSSWYRQDAVSVFCQSTRPTTTRVAVFSINDGTEDNRISGFIATSKFDAARNTSGAGVLFTPATTYAPDSVLNKLALASTNLDHAIAGNGGTVATAVTYNMPVVNRLDIGNQLTGTYLNGSLARLTVWPQALPNRLQSLTQ